VHPPADLRVDATQVRISALRLARAVWRHVGRHPRRDRHSGSGRAALHHAGAHVGRGRADAATQATQVQIAGGQVGSEVAAAVMGSVEQSATQKLEGLQTGECGRRGVKIGRSRRSGREEGKRFS